MRQLKIGIQLYTIREALERDFKSALRELASVGCDGVEFAWNFGGMEPEELACFLKECGLHACGMHVSPEELQDPGAKAFAYARALKVRYVTFSRCGEYPAILEDTIAACTAAGRAAAANNLTFTYHNHACELERCPDGIAALDALYRATNPAEVKAELDVYWITRAGCDPLEYIRRYADRLPQLHMKDMDPADGSFIELGRGCIDLKSCVDAARISPVCEWLIYEQDVCRRPQLECALESIAYLRKLLK